MRPSAGRALELECMSEFALIFFDHIFHALETDLPTTAWYVFGLSLILVIVVATDLAASVFIVV